jgi:hypothetical protein
MGDKCSEQHKGISSTVPQPPLYTIGGGRGALPCHRTCMGLNMHGREREGGGAPRYVGFCQGKGSG